MAHLLTLKLFPIAFVFLQFDSVAFPGAKVRRRLWARNVFPILVDVTPRSPSEAKFTN
jgi:hypothetical protein